MGDLFDDPKSAATEYTAGVRITITEEAGWRCDHCGAAFLDRSRRARLAARFDDPLFDRAIDLCPLCARLVARKLALLLDLRAGVEAGP